jgi:hypothetical protein
VTVEEYAFQLEVALERERHVNASLHEQLISNSEHVDYLMRNGKDDDEELEDGEAPYTQAESELLAEHKDALQRQNASLLSDREQLIGQVSSLAAGKRCGTYPGCVHSITFVLTTLSQPNQARPIHSAASSKTRLAGAEVALVEIELKAVADVCMGAQLAWLEDAAHEEVDVLRYNLHLSREALEDAEEAAQLNMAAALREREQV